MKRAIVLAILFAVAVGISLPLLSSEASRLKDRRAAAHARKKMKKHSRAWWRRYYARMRKKRALQRARKRAAATWRKKTAPAAAANKNPAAKKSGAAVRTAKVVPQSPNSAKSAISAVAVKANPPAAKSRRGRQVKSNHPPALPQPAYEPEVADARGGLFAEPGGDFSVNLPEGWSSRPVVVNGERKFMVFGPNGQPVGQATLASAWARETNDNGGNGRNRSLGGIPLRELRRSVIDKMAATNGWVVSDGEQEINGRRVFVVNAQTGSADGKPQQAWTYYFTEADGRIYSLTTNAPVEYSDKLSNDSSKMLGTFRTGTAQQAKPKSAAPEEKKEQQEE
jgi:hypothetical protein